ncbi:UNVERIFIED_CONTAM: hypothetical protein Slati_4159300 [Sesamum latifolium]|uniref:Uncharacterized protein n=1 Tax=Sesamum latifolium TaxID=2727402 RepID=A0AAW2T954_9LAMI
MACSDHGAILLSSKGNGDVRTPRQKPRFHFEAAWLGSENCVAMVERGWLGARRMAVGADLCSKI